MATPTFITEFTADPADVRCGELFRIAVTVQFGCERGNSLKVWMGGDVCQLRSGGQVGEVEIPVEAPALSTTIDATLDCPPETNAVLRLCARATDCKGESSPLRWRPLRVRCP